MRNRAGFGLVACLAAGWGTGCFDGGVVYDTSAPVQIRCESDDACPSGWVCRQNVQRCIPSELIAATEPVALDGDVEITPPVAGAGTRVLVRFRLTSEAAGEPQVFVELGEGRPALVLVESQQSDGDAWVYAYDVTGDEPSGAHDLTLEVTDELGQPATLPLGQVTFDFAAPRLTAADLAPRIAGEGDTPTLTLAFNEPLPETPVVTLHLNDEPADLALAGTDETDDRTGFTFAHTVAASDVEGEYTIHVVAEDAAGNVTEVELDPTLLVDKSAPTLVEALMSPAALVRPGDVVRVTVTLSESPATPPVLVATGDASATGALSFDRTTDADAVQVFTAVVPADAEGEFALALTDVEDAAGNAANDLSLPALTVDGTPPELVSYTQSSPAAQPGTPITISFSASEEVGAPPVLTFGGVDFGPDDPDADPWVFSLDVAPTSVEGVYPIQVTLRDVAGNVGVHVPGSLSVDTAPPQIVDVAFAPSSAALGTQVFLTVTVNEPLGAEPELTWSQTTGGLGPATYLGGSGLSYVFTWTITDATTTGVLVLDGVTVSDEAANTAVVDLLTELGAAPAITVDSVAPTVNALAPAAPAYSAVAGFNEVRVTFDVDDDAPVSSSPIVSLGGRPMTCGTMQSSSPHFSCTYDVVGDEPEGALPVLASILDDAGNLGFAASSVTLDFTPPGILPGTLTFGLVGGDGNPNLAPTRATEGSGVTIGFRLDEPAAPNSVEVTTTSPDVWTFSIIGDELGNYVAKHTVASGPTEGFYSLELRARDELGNEGTSALVVPEPGLRVDVTPPAAPTVDVADAVRLYRTPWGSDATNGEVELRVEANAGGFPGGSLVVFWTAPAPPRAELGRAKVRDDGGLDPATLLPADVGRIWAMNVDEAGNTAPPVRIRDVVWTATLGGKVTASTAENPNGLWQRPLHTFEGAGVISSESEEPQAVALADGVTTRLVGAGRWRAPNDDAPWQTSLGAAAYDQARGRMVMFGGYTNDQLIFTGVHADTWELTDGRWRKVTPVDPEGDGNPGSRCLHAMTYDPVRAVSVMFSGMPGCQDYSQDLWEYNGASWDQVIPSDPEGDGDPIFREGHGLVYDEARGQLLLYGGANDDQYFSDLWEWNGKSWRLIHDDAFGLSDGPGEREGFTFVYDSVNERVLLAGGYGATDVNVWSWDGAAWSEIVPTDVEGDGDPTANDLTWNWGVFDRDRGRLVALATNVWEFDGTSWLDRGPMPTEARVDGESPMVWHAAMGELVAYDGADLGNAGGTLLHEFHDVPWSWDGTDWTRHPLWRKGGQFEIPPRYEPSLVANPLTGALEIGGYSYEGVDEEPWQYIDGRLKPLTGEDVSNDGEPYGADTSLALWDENIQKMVTFESDTYWEHDGIDWHPTPITDPEGDGPGRIPTMITWDPTRDQIVQFRRVDTAGSPRELGRVFVWTGTSWSEEAVSDPEGDGNPLLYNDNYWWVHFDSVPVYDIGNDRLLLFEQLNGASGFVEVWEWTGSSWKLVPAADPEGDGHPSQRDGARLEWEPHTGHVILYGGRLAPALDESLQDMWRWTGGSWVRERVADPEGDGSPGVHQLGAMEVDPMTQQIVFYGGQDGVDSETDSFWIWDMGTEARPSFVVELATGLAGIDAGSELLTFDALAVGGGSGQLASVATDGAELLLWQAGRWRSVAQNTAQLGSPNVLTASLDAGETREVVQTSPLRSTLLAIVPRGHNGDARAEVEVDYVEVTLKYRLP